MKIKEIFDEIQETIMIIGALFLWGMFEYIVLTKPEVSAVPTVAVTRTALITIVTNLFTFKFTKNQSGGRNNGG